MKTKEPTVKPEPPANLPNPRSVPTQVPAGDFVEGEGLTIKGRVLSRKRREGKNKDGKTRFNIILAILAEGSVHMIERWSDEAMPSDLPVVGQVVALPVRVGAYLQSGLPKARLVWSTAALEGMF